MRDKNLSIDDLMVGNWVHCKFENKNYKLDGFGDDDRIETYGQPYVLIDGYKFNLLSDIEAIVLTPEIILKNGFTHETLFDTDDYVSEDKRIVVHSEKKYINSDNLWYVHIDNEDMNTTGSGEISFVHELQQLLKINGMKEFSKNIIV